MHSWCVKKMERKRKMNRIREKRHLARKTKKERKVDGHSILCWGNHLETQSAVSIKKSNLAFQLQTPGFQDKSSRFFSALKSLAVLTPTTVIHSNFFHQVIKSPDLERTTNPLSSKILSQYPEYSTTLNLLLNIDEIGPQEIAYAKQLDFHITHQDSKPTEKVYFSALHSALEIFMFAFHKRFMAPSFVCAYLSPYKCDWNPCNGTSIANYDYQNVIFEIDISEYNKKTSLLQPHHIGNIKGECLLSCYNVYEFKGYQYQHGIPTVYLQLLSFEDHVDSNSGRLRNLRFYEFSTEWLERRGNATRVRESSPEDLDRMVNHIVERYKSRNKDFVWGMKDSIPPIPHENKYRESVDFSEFMLCTEDLANQEVMCISPEFKGTQGMIVTDSSALVDILSDKNFRDEESSLFHQIKQLVVAFPTRTIMPRCFEMVFSKPLSSSEIAECMLDGGNRIIRKYTSFANWYCTRINLLLAIDRMEAEESEYAKRLNHCIIMQESKWSTLVYRGALHCPLEIFVFALKHKFFIPSFVSTSIIHGFWEAFPTRNPKPNYSYQNVMFEIDLTKYNKRSALITEAQTKYPDEGECLLSCYNVYEWKGYRYEDGIPIISLEVQDFESSVDSTGKIYGSQHGDLPLEWFERRGTRVRERNITPESFHYTLKDIVMRYKKSNPAWDDSSFNIQ
eukprot:TRINITY_DN3140_c0_g1_i2.p1 TRINITY_DN3140_c0_g1~~TRINITY_DN3140_c0_g1_i2.p1  ORF type:complete len:678 (-),score=88.74 TRINITY_DN3140_c0_g1_i2:3-2036(-)